MKERPHAINIEKCIKWKKIWYTERKFDILLKECWGSEEMALAWDKDKMRFEIKKFQEGRSKNSLWSLWSSWHQQC